MNKLKKLTSPFDKQKIANYKSLLKQKEGELKSAEETTDKTQKPRFYVTDGPHLYVSILLNRKGPLTAKQIWREYQKDEDAKAKDLFSSLTYLKQTILNKMREQNKIESAGYSRITKQFHGYKLNPKTAFGNVSPDIISTLEPMPDLGSRNLAAKDLTTPQITSQ